MIQILPAIIRLRAMSSGLVRQNGSQNRGDCHCNTGGVLYSSQTYCRSRYHSCMLNLKSSRGLETLVQSQQDPIRLHLTRSTLCSYVPDILPMLSEGLSYCGLFWLFLKLHDPVVDSLIPRPRTTCFVFRGNV